MVGTDQGLEAVAARASAQIGAENFPVALRVLPREPRTRLAALYRYARFVDDVGDETDASPAERLTMLDGIAADVRRILNGRPRLSAVAGVADVVRTCGAPIEELLALVEANRTDQSVRRYETFADLLDYCALSAAPVGRLVLHVAGAARAANILDSDQVCNALQVLEHCQDVGEDARAGRVYLPQVDLRAFAVAPDDLLAGSTSAPLRRVVAVQVDRAADLLRSGPPLVRRLSGWARVAVAGYVAGGLATVDALRRHDHDVLATTVRPSNARTAYAAAKLLVGRG